MKTYIYIFSVLLFFVASCGSKSPVKIDDQTPGKDENLELTEEQKKNLAYDTVQYVNEFDELVVVGEISFDEDNIIRVYPIVSGSVDKINVSLGDYVKKGQLLARIISTDINQYQVDFNIARSNMLLMEKQYKRIQDLYASNFASEKELFEAETDYKNAQAEYDGKKQLLELYGGSAERNDAVFNVYAPISGYIVERNINEGTQIRTDNNQNMFTISDLKTVWAWASVYESDISKVHVGDEVDVNTIAYPDKYFTGKINKIGSTLDPEARVVKVRVDLDNPGELLKPEMFATIAIRPQTENKILAIPTASIFIENNVNKVVVVDKTGKFYKKQVVEGKVSRGYTEIKEGLDPGEIIVSKGGLFVSAAINNQ